MPPFAKVAEISAVSTSVLGVIASVVTQQVVYSAAPISMALFLSTFNKFRLEQQLKQDQRTALEGVDIFIQGISADLDTKIKKGIEDRLNSLHSAFPDPASSDTQLLFGRKASREILIHSLKSADEHLLLICPWLNKFAMDSQLLHHLQSALERDVVIDIGWGRLQDLQSGEFRQSVYYDALPLLEQMTRQYQNLRLKPISTHEKILVCDRNYAVIGSHNFLTSDDGSFEREVSLKTMDQNVIHQLLARFQEAPHIERMDKVTSLNKSEIKRSQTSIQRLRAN